MDKGLAHIFFEHERNIKNLPDLPSRADRIFLEYVEKNKNAFIEPGLIDEWCLKAWNRNGRPRTIMHFTQIDKS